MKLPIIFSFVNNGNERPTTSSDELVQPSAKGWFGMTPIMSKKQAHLGFTEEGRSRVGVGSM
jgi:hypothetical protein